MTFHCNPMTVAHSIKEQMKRNMRPNCEIVGKGLVNYRVDKGGDIQFRVGPVISIIAQSGQIWETWNGGGSAGRHFLFHHSVMPVSWQTEPQSHQCIIIPVKLPSESRTGGVIRGNTDICHCWPQTLSHLEPFCVNHEKKSYTDTHTGRDRKRSNNSKAS